MNRKVLIIDDDSDDRDLFCEALKEEDAEVGCDCAASADEAYKVLASASRLPDLVFLDINMAVANGWQCLTTLKKDERYKHLPVIIYSTSSHERDKGIARDLGALSYITKPDTVNGLKMLLQDILHHVSRNTLHTLTIK